MTRSIARPMTARNTYPGGRTRKQWQGLIYKQRHRLVTQAQCDLLRLWALCKHKRCRRQRSCLGDPFDCLWKRRDACTPTQRVALDKRLKPLDELRNMP